MREIPEDILYDQRLVERHIAQGLITREQVEQRLAKLNDVGELGDVIDVQSLQDREVPGGAEPKS